MKVSNYLETEPNEEVPGSIKRVVIGPDDGAPNFIMRVIELVPGGSSPFHTHPWEHEVFVLSGRGAVKGEQGETPITKDSVIYIAPEEKHCLVNKGDEPLRFV